MKNITCESISGKTKAELEKNEHFRQIFDQLIWELTRKVKGSE